MNPYSEENLNLRLANKKDEELLLNWANDATVKKWSFLNSSEIEVDEHKKWFKEKLKSNDVRIWILEKQNFPCGQIRIEKSEKQAVLHYSIASDFRGKSFGSKMLQMAILKTFSEWPETQIIAYTVPGNIASNSSLEKAGFIEISSTKEEKCFIFENTKTSRVIIESGFEELKRAAYMVD